MPTVALLSCHSSVSEYNADFDYCVVFLSKEVCQKVLRRIKLFRRTEDKDDQLLEMYFWFGGMEFTTDRVREVFQLTEEQEGDLDDSVPVILDVTEEQLDKITKHDYEIGQMIVSDDAVRFLGSPKHTDLYITTDKIGLEKLARYSG